LFCSAFIIFFAVDWQDRLIGGYKHERDTIEFNFNNPRSSINFMPLLL